MKILEKILRIFSSDKPIDTMSVYSKAISKSLREAEGKDFISGGLATREYLRKRHESFVEMAKLKDKIEAEKMK